MSMEFVRDRIPQSNLNFAPTFHTELTYHQSCHAFLVCRTVHKIQSKPTRNEKIHGCLPPLPRRVPTSQGIVHLHLIYVRTS